MNNTINTTAVLGFFTGKNRAAAETALESLMKSIELGEWVPGVSRSVKSVISKNNLAQKAARAARKAGLGLSSWDSDAVEAAKKRAIWDMCFALLYGTLDSNVNVAAVVNPTKAEGALIKAYTEYTAAFSAVGEAIAKLDATRPKPVFTKAGLSPTVHANLASLKASDINVCPLEAYEVVVKGETQTRYRLKWPDGTRHGTSRFCSGEQCEACGHGIKVRNNWVPLVLTTAEGPKSLWAGRDCAKRLFEIDVKGVLEIDD